ncbi:MAG TPA: hypothetical protein VMS88_04710, partial [Terriglobales bacterium]|nr:hypothetical protein [Terriglobales bacterium]
MSPARTERARPRTKAGSPRSPRAAPAWHSLPAAGLLAALALAALLLAAPPLVRAFWAVNGFRSIPLTGRLGLLAAAALAAYVAWRPPTRVVWWVLALAAGIAIAFPLRESIHWLSDTGLRFRMIELSSTGEIRPMSFGDLTWRLHMHPLDGLLETWIPLALVRHGMSPRAALSAVSLALFLLFAAGIGPALGASPAGHEPRARRLALVAAVLLAGTLEVFAGYAESTGLVLAAGIWWIAALRAPLRRVRDATLPALAWLVFFACHRLALAMLPVQILRHAALPDHEDRPEARRAALVADGAAALLAAAFFALSRGRLAGMDLRQLLLSVSAGGGPRLVPLADVLNLLVLVAPLALLAPWFAGRAAWADLARSRGAWLLAIGALILLPMMLVFPVAPNGLGAQRDWD